MINKIIKKEATRIGTDNSFIRAQKILSEIALKITLYKDFQSTIESVLKQLGSYVGASRVYVFEDSPDGKFTNNTHEWCATGIEPQKDNLQNISYEILGSWSDILDKEGKILADDISNLPKNLYKLLVVQDIKAILVLPLGGKGTSFGFIGFDDTKSYRKWSESDIFLLTTIAGLLSNTYLMYNTETRLEETKKNYDSFFNAIDDFLFVLDEQGNIIHVNDIVVNRLGFSENELLGKSVLLVHPEERRKEAEDIVSQMLQGKADVCSVPIVTKSGKQIPVETRITHGMWNGKPAFFRVTKDVSQLRISEENLLVTTERLTMATKAGGVGIWDYDVANNKLVWDEQMYVLYGITADKFSGAYDAWQSGLHPDDKSRGDKEIQMALDGEREFDTEFRVLWPDKSIHFIRALAIVLRDGSGNPLRMLGTNWDITDRKNTEERLKGREQVLQKTLVDSTGFIGLASAQLDYSKLAETMRNISGAAYVSFNIFEEDGLDFTTVALSGVSENLTKVTSVLGFEVVNKKWKHDPVRAKKIQKGTITLFDSLHELTGAVISENISSLIEKTFNIGKVAIVRVKKNNLAIGDFTLLFSRGFTLGNRDTVGLFASLTGQIILRSRAEEALLDQMNESKRVNALMVDREIKMIALKDEIKKLKSK